MTEKQIREIAKGGEAAVKAIPWDSPTFIFVPGRYYSCMIAFEILDVIRPGSFCGLLWRYEDKPGEWIFTYRFRWHVDNKVFGSKDEKSWYAAKLEAKTEGEAYRNTRQFLACVEATGCVRGVDVLEIRGGADKWMELQATGNLPHWLYSQQERAE